MEPRKIWILVAIIGVCLLLAMNLRYSRSAADDTPRHGVKWEYKQLHSPSDEEMNKLGAEGWELVSIRGGDAYIKSSSTQGGTTNNTVEYGKSIATFKRLVVVK